MIGKCFSETLGLLNEPVFSKEANGIEHGPHWAREARSPSGQPFLSI